MSTTTENLGLFKYDPNTDGTNTFNIEQALNDNWDKLDAAVSAAQSADGYDASRSYAVGDYCLHDGTLYRCTTATAGEAWNAAHWVATTLAAELTCHIADTVSHVTAAERDAWNAKPDAVHAARHASSGADPITPASIGAAAANHTHTPASIGAAAANHTHTLASLGAAAANHTHTPASIGAAAVWMLIAQYKAAGSYTWTVPAGVTQIGVYMVGGGGSGAAANAGTQGKASGGASGYGKNLTLTVTPGQNIPVVVGAGGAAVVNSGAGKAGGTTSFNGVTVSGGEGGKYDTGGGIAEGASGGQGSDVCSGRHYTNRELCAGASTISMSTVFGGRSQSPRVSQNQFDPSMVSLCAGGGQYDTVVAMPDGTKGGDGAAGYANNASVIGEDATGNGNGGGGASNVSSSGVGKGYTLRSGAGSPGMVLIYAKAV